jgi:hypothetical protein
VPFVVRGKDQAEYPVDLRNNQVYLRPPTLQNAGFLASELIRLRQLFQQYN